MLPQRLVVFGTREVILITKDHQTVLGNYKIPGGRVVFQCLLEGTGKNDVLAGVANEHVVGKGRFLRFSVQGVIS